MKACLLDRSGHKSNYHELKTPIEVAEAIYEQLKTSLNKKLVVSTTTSERPVDCTKCDHEYGCCKQRKLMLAMVEKVLDWLKEHKDELQDIDYADVDLTLEQFR